MACIICKINQNLKKQKRDSPAAQLVTVMASQSPPVRIVVVAVGLTRQDGGSYNLQVTSYHMTHWDSGRGEVGINESGLANIKIVWYQSCFNDPRG